MYEGHLATDPVLDALISDAEARPIPRLTPRRATLASVPGQFDAVIGMRRSGKTWRLFQRLAELEQEGVNAARRPFLNFEDERRAPLEAKDLQRIPDALDRRHRESRARFDNAESIRRRVISSTKASFRR